MLRVWAPEYHLLAKKFLAGGRPVDDKKNIKIHLLIKILIINDLKGSHNKKHSQINPLGGKLPVQYLKVDVQTDCVPRFYHHKVLHVAIFKLWPYWKGKI